MHRLRSSLLISRFVLAWFVSMVGLAGAAPFVQPQSMALVCGAAGGVKLVVVSASGDGDSTPQQQALGPHGLDCSLCLQLQAPPPSNFVVAAAPAAQPLALPTPVSEPPTFWSGAALPARGPPRSTAL